MWYKLIRILGIVFIVFFCAISIFFSTAQRDLPESIQQIFAYTSFFEDRFYDFRMNIGLKKEKTIDPDQVLLRIDDESLNKIGRWPFSRAVWGRAMERLEHFDAKVVAFDVYFSEPEKSCEAVPPDDLFADSIKKFQSKPGKKVILPYSLNMPPFAQELPEELYNFILDTKQAAGLNLGESQLCAATFPIKKLAATDASIGIIGAEDDPDGIFRHYPLIANLQSLYLPSLSLLAYQHYKNDKPVLEITNMAEALLKLKQGQLHINFKGETKVRWLGDGNHFKQVSIYDLLNAKDNDPKMMGLIKDKIIFVGSTAFGAHDLRHTPVDAMMPGIFFHMNMTHMLLADKFFAPKDHSALYSWLILFIGTLLIIVVQYFKHAILDVFAMLFIVAAGFYIDTYFLLPIGLEIKLFFCLLSVIAVYSWNTLLNFYLATKDKQFLKSAFGNYISPELIDQMYKKGEAPKLGGDVGVRTAYFTDIQGFSTFSEKLTATKLVELLNEYLTAMTDILLEEGGTLDKYEGDAIIAFFGAPMPMEDHAPRALKVAHRMQERLLELRKKWISEGDKWPTIVHEMRMRIGINSGEIVTGNMGSKTRMNYTMMGDSVNLAARLESSAKQYGVFVQMAKASYMLSEHEFLCRELDTVRVVGKSEPVITYELLWPKEGAPKLLVDLKEIFEKGIALYKKQNWDEAIKCFEKTRDLEWERFPELKDKKGNPSLMYLERCLEFKKNPPPANWDGVYTLTEK